MSKIKICGLSRIEDIIAVNAVLPDYIGFVFAPSPRRIDEKAAAGLKSRLDGRIKTVGVFVNAEIGIVANLCQSGVIDLVQLHGDEDVDYIKRLKEQCGRPVIKAVRLRPTPHSGIPADSPRPIGSPSPDGFKTRPPMSEIPDALPPLPENADYLLFDTLSAKRGGAGKAFDWGVLRKYSGPPYFLAGGMNTANIPQAISTLAPYAIDVSSGAESDGKKDAAKIREIVRQVRA